MDETNKTIRDARSLGIPKMLLLGLQHMFAMFGATILVPILVNNYFNGEGLSVSVTLFFAGVVLAKFLGYDFVDTDLVIQEKTGKLLHELITEYGLDGFKKIEEDINAGISCQRSVIAPGGSVVYGEKAMKHFKEIGKVVYLKISYEELEGRLGNLQSRGVALKEGQTLLDLYHERVPYYEKYADITIEEQGLGVEETINRIAKELGLNS